MTDKTWTPDRRTVVKGIGAALAAPLAAPLAKPFVAPALAANNEPIRYAVVAAQIADHTDYLNGAILAVDEINAAGGAKGRQIKIEHHDCDIFTPDGIQAGYRAVVDTKPHAIGSAFVPLARQTMLEALGDYKAPLLTGDTNIDLITFAMKNRDKYWNYFQVDPPEIYYGRMFPRFLDTVAAGGVWKPTNNKVHIIREQNNYNMQIAKEVLATLPSSKFELATITDIQYPVQDWGPVMQDIKKVQAGVIMLDYWVGAEEAAFCQQFVADPVKGALVYIQYGASQPEFLNVAQGAAEGIVWSTVLGVYADKQGMEFRKKYAAKHPGVIGLCYTGSAYDTAYILKNAWDNVDPSDFKKMAEYIKTHTYRGVDGAVDMNNEYQAALHYPLQTEDLSKGMAQLYFQVQGGQHKIIQPTVLAESQFRAFPWA